MRQMIVKINKEEELLYPAFGYILGVKNYSVCFEKSFDLDEIKNIRRRKLDKKIFVSLNRVIFNDELKTYRDTLKKLDNMGLDGIIVGDIAVLTYDLKTSVILDQMHLNNSSYSIKHYFNNSVSGFVLTNDITLDEINKIKENNKGAILFKQVFGLPHLSTSRRKLVSNYLNNFGLKAKDKVYEIKENNKDDSYFIIEDYFGTHILSENPLNLLKYIDLLNVDYLIFDSFLLKTSKFIYDAFYKKNLNFNKIINDTFNANEGFINKETIYKVKKND